MATTRGVSLARVGRRCASARVGVSRASVVKSARARAVGGVKTRAAREGEEDSAAAAKTGIMHVGVGGFELAPSS